jgi:hypothetical protein
VENEHTWHLDYGSFDKVYRLIFGRFLYEGFTDLIASATFYPNHVPIPVVGKLVETQIITPYTDHYLGNYVEGKLQSYEVEGYYSTYKRYTFEGCCSYCGKFGRVVFFDLHYLRSVFGWKPKEQSSRSLTARRDVSYSLVNWLSYYPVVKIPYSSLYKIEASLLRNIPDLIASVDTVGEMCRTRYQISTMRPLNFCHLGTLLPNNRNIKIQHLTPTQLIATSGNVLGRLMFRFATQSNVTFFHLIDNYECIGITIEIYTNGSRYWAWDGANCFSFDWIPDGPCFSKFGSCVIWRTGEWVTEDQGFKLFLSALYTGFICYGLEYSPNDHLSPSYGAGASDSDEEYD